MNEEDIFTEDLVRSWFWEIMWKIFNIHLVGIALLAFFLYDITIAFLIVYLIIYDTCDIFLKVRQYKKEFRFIFKKKFYFKYLSEL